MQTVMVRNSQHIKLELIVDHHQSSSIWCQQSYDSPFIWQLFV